MKKLIFTTHLIKWLSVCAIIGVLSGCSLEDHRTTCAWCKSPIEHNVYNWDQIQHIVGVWVIDPNDPSGMKVITTKILGPAKTLNEAHALMSQEDKKYGYYSKDGYVFDSLKCMNAYYASLGIKEQRFRYIQGE